MRTLIFEPGTMGHRLHHVRHIAAALAELPAQVVVSLAADAPASAEFAAHLADLGDGAKQSTITLDASIPPMPAGWIDRATHAARQLRACIDRHRPDHLYVPSGDGISQVLGAYRSLGRSTIPRELVSEAMILRGGFAYPQFSRKAAIKAKLSWAAARRAPWSAVHVLDPLVYERIQRDDRVLAARTRLMPEPVETPPRNDRFAARRELGLAEDGRYIACVGLINNRKGCDRLIDAFAAANNLAATDRLLLAGVIDPETQPTLRREPVASLLRSKRIVCIDRTLSNAELLTAIEAADLIVAFYPQHIGSASIAIRAAAQGRPVLASHSGWLGAIVPRYALGTTIQTEQLSPAIESALERAPAFQLTPAGARFVAFHTVENFKAHWTAALRQQLGLPRSPSWIEFPSHPAAP